MHVGCVIFVITVSRYVCEEGTLMYVCSSERGVTRDLSNIYTISDWAAKHLIERFPLPTELAL